MRQAALFHPRVFSDQEWAEAYYKRNAKNITKVGNRFAKLLKDSEFKGGKVLDAGCGFGAVAIEIAKAFPNTEIIGVDLGEPLLELGQSLVDQAGCSRQITLQKGNARELDFPTDTFDLVISTFMSHIVDEPVKMFNEIERVTKPEGRIMITDLRRIWLGLIIRKLRTALTLEEALEIIRKSDLRPGTPSKGPFWWDYVSEIRGN